MVSDIFLEIPQREIQDKPWKPGNARSFTLEVWERPLVKVAPKYGISAVALGKVCHKLQIPLPGRGYWTEKGAR